MGGRAEKVGKRAEQGLRAKEWERRLDGRPYKKALEQQGGWGAAGIGNRNLQVWLLTKREATEGT